MKRIKKVKPELRESMFGKITCPHCGKTHGVDLNVLSMLCKHCGNPIKLMWETKIK
jgi:transcription elongation factor Elf1